MDKVSCLVLMNSEQTITTEHPYYILRTNEKVMIPKNDSKLLYYLRKSIIVICVIIIIWSIFAQKFILFDLNSASVISLIIGVIAVFSLSEKKEQAAPLELQFYKDYLIVYKRKHYYDTKLSRMEFDKFYYKDITKCQYKAISKRILIFGKVEGTWYNYKNDGTVSLQPSYHKTTESMSSFYTDIAPEIDFVKEIESHSPIKVIIEENL